MIGVDPLFPGGLFAEIIQKMGWFLLAWAAFMVLVFGLALLVDWLHRHDHE
jgi:hypothetical protein